VDGKPVKVAYAFPSPQPGFIDKKTEDTRVLLTDVTLPGKAIKHDFTRINLVKQGKLHCLAVTINAKQQSISVTVRHPVFKVP
jgi:hypothetical protein